MVILSLVICKCGSDRTKMKFETRWEEARSLSLEKELIIFILFIFEYVVNIFNHCK